MDDLLKRKIEFQISAIDQLFVEYELIFEKIKMEKPDLFELTLLGNVLHSFYQGLENIFELIAKNIDDVLPTGSKSHKELLHQMASENEKRNEIISEKQYVKLLEYATFRHFFRHTYAFQLKWEKMESLVESISEKFIEIYIYKWQNRTIKFFLIVRFCRKIRRKNG